MAESLRAFGADEATIAEATKRQSEDCFAVWPENEPVLEVLFAMRTQWRTGGMNGAIYGLDYSVLPWVMKQIGMAETKELFYGLQIAESEAVKCLAAR